LERRVIFWISRCAAALAAVCASLAHASEPTRLLIDAAPAPIIDARINDRPARLEIDTRLPSVILLNRDAARRLGVRLLPVVRVALDVDDETSVRGRVARPRVTLADGVSLRALTGVFPVAATSRADGRIGPGALPHDVVSIRLRADGADLEDIALAWPDQAHWRTQVSAAGQTLGLVFDIEHEATIFNRDAARMLDHAGAVRADGALTDREILLGLRTSVQPIVVGFPLLGRTPGPAFAMTAAPLFGAAEPGALVVRARTDTEPRPGVTLGRGALDHCASITADRARRQLILRCARIPL